MQSILLGLKTWFLALFTEQTRCHMQRQRLVQICAKRDKTPGLCEMVLYTTKSYPSLTSPVFTPLGACPVFMLLDEPSIYAAWRVQYLRRLAGPVFTPLGGFLSCTKVKWAKT